MNAEIVAVGTELLLGQIANTNAQHLSARLAEAGINVYLHTVVGDNLERARRVLSEALERSDVVIVTGGLGPTPDDLTREAVAGALGVGLAADEALAATVRAVFDRMGRYMPEDNLRQADLPSGATPIPPVGTAPGFWIETRGRILFAVPGVPWEMRAMLEGTVLPILEARSRGGALVSRQVLVIGLGESGIHEAIRDIVAGQSNPTIAFLAAAGQVRVRITASASTRPAAAALIAPVEQAVRARLGDHALPGDFSDIVTAFAHLMTERSLTVGAAESLTGGLVAAELTRAGGASDFFRGSLVVYHPGAKQAVAGVAAGVLDGPGGVSEEAARAMAEGAAARLDADLGISATGVAGPEPSEGKPVGLVYVGAAYQGRTEVRSLRGYGDRENIRRLAVTAVLDLGRRVVLAGGPAAARSGPSGDPA